MNSNFARNLRELCERVKSVSELCRDLSINRQQFARYLSGENRPSPYNLRRIADHFHVTAAELLLPHNEFVAVYEEPSPSSKLVQPDLVARSLVPTINELELIKPLAGYYSVYFQSPSEPELLLKSLVHIQLDKDRCVSRWEESFTRTKDGSFQASRYEGVVRFLSGHLFIIDVEVSTRETILETILQIPYRRKTKLFVGVTMGLTTGQQRLPFASVVAFQSLGRKVHLSSKRRQCGFVEVNSRAVEPVVRNVFAQQRTSLVFPRVLREL